MDPGTSQRALRRETASKQCVARPCHVLVFIFSDLVLIENTSLIGASLVHVSMGRA